MNLNPNNKKIVLLALVFIVLVVGINILLLLKNKARSKTLSTSQSANREGTNQSSFELVNVDKTKNFSILISSNPSTGYSWEAKFDESYLKLAKSTYTPNPDSKKLGASGTQSFEFTALKTGETEITFNYLRPWEKDKPPQETKLYKVTIH